MNSFPKPRIEESKKSRNNSNNYDNRENRAHRANGSELDESVEGEDMLNSLEQILGIEISVTVS